VEEATVQVDEPDGEPFKVVGVGPWEGDWPTGDHFDPELLREGDRRNVIDQYRYWKLEAIVADLDTKRHPMHIAIENLGHDFNIGTIVRSANAFLVGEVHIVGKKRWNRRGAMVTDRCVLVVGQEGTGLSEPMRMGCDSLVEISQFGSTRSINVGAAAAIAMHEWVRQWAV
jgi:tRNA G18 (ribose-2'-O)-methylase SpoU